METGTYFNYYRTHDMNLATYLSMNGVDLVCVEPSPEERRKGLFVMRIDRSDIKLSTLLDQWEISEECAFMKKAFLHRKKMHTAIAQFSSSQN